jgi:hypothetical protein|tara:strand:+ start:48 stop:458 length:411 start_codon:yes stop_codon:yes gene_type:complete
MGNNSTEVAYGFGQMGSIFTNANTQVVAPDDKVIVAIQFLADTTFDELSPEGGTSALGGICVGDATDEKGAGLEVAAASGSTGGIMNDGASGGQIINAAGDSNLTVFPKGMVLYGRWKSFTIDADADGGVIAYLGY